MNIERLLGATSRQRTWVAAAIVGGSAITAGAGMYSASQNGGAPGIEDKFIQGPSFAAGQQAQGDWLSQLTSDKNDPTGNFGAISPDWNDIWSQTEQKVNNYYNGSAMNPGVRDQVKASFAQRGMSGDPAASFLDAQVGANQAQDLGNLSAQQNIAKQTFAQNAKQNWYSNMNNFNNSTMQEQGSWTGAMPYATPGQQVGNAIGATGTGLASAGIQYMGNQQQMNWLNGMTQNPSTYAPTVGADYQAAGLI